MNRQRSVILLAAFLLAKAAFGQPMGPASPERDRGWVTVGFGRGWPDDIGGGMSANIGRERVLQFGYHGAGELFGGSGAAAVNVSIGRSQVNRWVRVAAFIGPAWVWGERPRDGPYDPESFSTPGMVGSIEGVLTPFKEMGLGMELFMVLNMKRSVAGMTLTLVFEGNK